MWRETQIRRVKEDKIVSDRCVYMWVPLAGVGDIKKKKKQLNMFLQAMQAKRLWERISHKGIK